VQHVHRFPSASPWRAATIVLGAVAALELVGLLVVGGVRLAPAHHGTAAAPAAAKKPAVRHAKAKIPTVAPTPLRPRAHVRVLVLNGNGVTGAAASAAATLRVEGYRIGGAENAQRHNYARSVVMYVPGWAKEARRLARDIRIRTVSPLDGMVPSKLKGSKLVLLLGT
jgi:hypothetical protein